MNSERTVLLVEDEERQRTILRNLLEKRGFFKVLEAASGAEAVRVSEEYAGRIDVLLSDVLLPELSGPELGTAVRAQRPDIAILFMSGYSEDLATGADTAPSGARFIGKPFESSQLLDTIADMIAPD